MGRRVKIEIPKESQVEVVIGDKTVKIDSIISLEKYETIMSDLKETVLYNSEIVDKYMLLQIRYIRDILDVCTNIDISEFSGEDLNSQFLSDLLAENICNFYEVQEAIIKEYEKYILESSFSALGESMPSSEDMEKSMKALSETIDKLPEDKLELISKSIVWNNMPALGAQVAPAEHIEGE